MAKRKVAIDTRMTPEQVMRLIRELQDSVSKFENRLGDIMDGVSCRVSNTNRAGQVILFLEYEKSESGTTPNDQVIDNIIARING